MKKLYTVAILGATGAVGQEMMKVLEERDFPVGKLIPLASERSAGKTLKFKGEDVTIGLACNEAFQGVDIVLGLLKTILPSSLLLLSWQPALCLWIIPPHSVWIPKCP